MNQKMVQQPRILKLWLLFSFLWLIMASGFVAFMYWYYDEKWLLNHKFLIVLILFAGLFACIVVPILWRIFVVIDGQERTIRLIERSEYIRESHIQKNLDAFALYLQQKFKLPIFNQHYILAVHGIPDAFSDVGVQLIRNGWVRVNNVYLVLINDIDEIAHIPLFRGKYHCPFDGLVILRNLKTNETAVTSDNCKIWLEKFYKLLNWRVPFVHVYQSDITLNKFPVSQIFNWQKVSEQAISDFKNKAYSLFSQAFLKSQDMQFLLLIDELERTNLELENQYGKDQLAWCMGIGLQSKHSNWWESWESVTYQLHKRTAKRYQSSMIIRCAKLNMALCSGFVFLILVSFIKNYHEIKMFQNELKNISQLQKENQAPKTILALQHHMAILQNTHKPFYARLGFSHDAILLTKSFAAYGQATRKWIIKPTDEQIIVVLKSLQQFNTYTNPEEELNPTEKISSEVALAEGFDALKAYLMLRDSKHIDNIFLSDYLSHLYQSYTHENADMIQQIFKFYTRNMFQYPNWFLEQDETLVAQSRSILNILVNEQQQDIEIYQNLLNAAKQKFGNIKLEQLVGKESNQFWKNTEQLPGMFTLKAWNEWFKPEIDKINPEHFKSGSWVLNEDQTDNIDFDIRKQVMKLYKQDYYNAWQKFLSGIQWIEVEGLNKQMGRLKKYSDKKNSILVKLLQVIQRNASIGYDEDKTDGGKGVLLTFEPIVNLIKPISSKDKQIGRELDSYQENLLVMYLEVQKIQGAGNQASASQLSFNTLLGGHGDSALAKAEQSIDLQVANLGEEWQEIGRNLLSFPFNDSKKVVLIPALNHINEMWQQMVVAQWNNRFASKYPINPSGSQDVSLQELQKFIDPDTGVVAQFNRQYLNNVLNLVGNQWQINPVVTEQIQVDGEFISGLNELNQLLEFVADGSKTASFEVKLQSSPEIKQIHFQADKQQLDYFNEKPFWRKINWPIDMATDKKVALQWTDINNQTGNIEVIGDLSILRLFEKSSARLNDDDSYNLKWKINDRMIEMDVKSLQTNDFITLLKLKNFPFPQQVFKVSQNDN